MNQFNIFCRFALLSYLLRNVLIRGNIGFIVVWALGLKGFDFRSRGVASGIIYIKIRYDIIVLRKSIWLYTLKLCSLNTEWETILIELKM